MTPNPQTSTAYDYFSLVRISGETYLKISKLLCSANKRITSLILTTFLIFNFNLCILAYNIIIDYQSSAKIYQFNLSIIS